MNIPLLTCKPPRDLKGKPSLLEVPAEPCSLSSCLLLTALAPALLPPLHSPWALVAPKDPPTHHVFQAPVPLLSAVPPSDMPFLLCVVNSFLAFKFQVKAANSRSRPWPSPPPPLHCRSSFLLLSAPRVTCLYPYHSILHPNDFFKYLPPSWMASNLRTGNRSDSFCGPSEPPVIPGPNRYLINACRINDSHLKFPGLSPHPKPKVAVR